MAPLATTLRDGLRAVASSPAALARDDEVNPRSRASASTVCQMVCGCGIMVWKIWAQQPSASASVLHGHGGPSLRPLQQTDLAHYGQPAPCAPAAQGMDHPLSRTGARPDRQGKPCEGQHGSMFPGKAHSTFHAGSPILHGTASLTPDLCPVIYGRHLARRKPQYNHLLWCQRTHAPHQP